jgi:hypothetical protein
VVKFSKNHFGTLAFRMLLKCNNLVVASDLFVCLGFA